MTKTVALLPCRFCGEEWVKVRLDVERGHYAECQQCGACGPGTGDGDEQAAIAAWNTRTKTDQQLREEVERLRKANDNLVKWLFEACGGFPVSEEAFAAFAHDLLVIAREMSRPFEGRTLAEFRAEIEAKIEARSSLSSSSLSNG